MHYPLLVIHREDQSVEELLAPYDEALEVEEPYIETYAEDMIIEHRRELNYQLNDMKRSIKNNKPTCVWLPNDDLKPERDDFFWIPTQDDIKEAEELLALNDDELLQVYIDSYKRNYGTSDFDKDKNKLTYDNPQGYWDSWVIGGRFDGLIPTSHGTNVNECLLSEIKFTPDITLYNKYLHLWRYLFEIEEKDDDEEFINEYLLDHAAKAELAKHRLKKKYKAQFRDEHHFAEVNSVFSTYYVITPDGVWHEDTSTWEDEWRKNEINIAEITTMDYDPHEWELKFAERFLKNKEESLIATVIDIHR